MTILTQRVVALLICIATAAATDPVFAQAPNSPQPPVESNDAADEDATQLRGLFRDLVGLGRQAIIGRSSDRLGLIDEGAWSGANDPNRWVILVHGFASGVDATNPLREQLDRPGIRCRRFAYPNDGPISQASDQLSQTLKQLRTEFPERKLTVIAHSMGCLVTRNVLESPELDPGNVDQFLMIAPPNKGSNLAQFPIGLDPEKITGTVRSPDARLVVEGVLEGMMGSAQVELRPDSPFLKKMNQRSRNPRIRYTIFAGDAGPVAAEDAEQIKQIGEDLSQKNAALAILTDQLVATGNSSEVVAGKGDGAVSIESARLEGVTDFVVLPFSHNVMSQNLDSPVGKQLLEAIASRIVL